MPGTCIGASHAGTQTQTETSSEADAETPMAADCAGESAIHRRATTIAETKAQREAIPGTACRSVPGPVGDRRGTLESNDER
jgi:hypothetical protein